MGDAGVIAYWVVIVLSVLLCEKALEVILMLIEGRFRVGSVREDEVLFILVRAKDAEYIVCG